MAFSLTTPLALAGILLALVFGTPFIFGHIAIFASVRHLRNVYGDLTDEEEDFIRRSMRSILDNSRDMTESRIRTAWMTQALDIRVQARRMIVAGERLNEMAEQDDTLLNHYVTHFEGLGRSHEDAVDAAIMYNAVTTVEPEENPEGEPPPVYWRSDELPPAYPGLTHRAPPCFWGFDEIDFVEPTPEHWLETTNGDVVVAFNTEEERETAMEMTLPETLTEQALGSATYADTDGLSSTYSTDLESQYSFEFDG